jgi:two-component system, OmpR family, sensor histidine kinase BaeS
MWGGSHHRQRFMRRAGCFLALVLFLSAVGATTLISLAAGRSSTVVIAAVIAFLIIAIFFGAMRRFGFPFADIVAAAERVGDGDYSTQLAEHGMPSLRSVARAFNSMTARLRANEQLRRHLMADIAHELRTPLTIIQGRLEALIDGVYPRDDARLQELLEETRVVARLVEDLRTLANADSGALALQKEPSDLVLLIHDAANSLASEAEARGVALRIDEGEELPLLLIDPLRIREVLVNLLANAIHHTPAGGSVSVGAGQRNDSIFVRVTDTGSGIAADELPKIFDRFYKGASSKGSGLGLTIARNLVEAHGGEIHAESEIGKGTTITFVLPVSL